MIKTIAIEGMHCQHCVKAVNDALAAVPGVEAVEVSLEKKQATVKGQSLDAAALQAAVEDTGFDVLSVC